MQVVPFGDQICNECKWYYQAAKFVTNASGAMQLRRLLVVNFANDASTYKYNYTIFN